MARIDWLGYTREDGKVFVGRGWHSLIDEAFDLIGQNPGTMVVDIKEKWGGLHIYIDYVRDPLFDQIEEICDRSYKICEFCGRKGEQRDIGWVKTLCWCCYVRELFYKWWTYNAARLRRNSRHIWKRLVNKNKHE